MKFFTKVKGLLVATLCSFFGSSVFLTLVFCLLYLYKSRLPISEEPELIPPNWFFLLLFGVLIGVVLSAVFAGLWGYSRYMQSLTRQSSGTGESVLP